MFGQNKPLFGNPTSAPSAFGTPSTSGFGAPAQPTFGAAQPQQQSLFGGGGFGSPQPATGLFGQPQQTSIFGATAPTQPTTGFGTQAANTGFGRPAGMSLFGGTTAATTGNMFGGNTFGQGATAFGGTQAAPVGTTIKFTAPSGTDTMMKNNQSTTIATRHQCITAMKEYETKSLEELRFEDYQANRKGPQQGYGQAAVAAPQATSLFGAATATPTAQVSPFGTSTGGLFGQSITKPSAFGASIPTSTANTSLFGNANTFGKPTFGNPGTAFGAVTPQPQAQPVTGGLFGQPTQTFGAQTPSLFGNPQQNAAAPKTFGGFGTPTTQQQQPTSLFGANTFGAGLQANASAQKPLFGSTQPSFGTTTGAATAFPTFSTATTSTSSTLFGAGQPSLFSTNTAQKPFSFNTTTPGFGGGLTSSAPSLTGGGSTLFNTGAGAFGTSTLGGGGLFGNSATSGSSLFPSLQQQPQMGLSSGLNFGQSTVTNSISSPPNNEQLLSRLQALPYGNSPLFQNDLLPPAPASASKFTTDAKTLNLYKIGAKPTVVKRQPATGKSSLLFDGIDDENHHEKTTALDIFKPRKNIKKLEIKSKRGSSESGNESMVSNVASEASSLKLPDVRKNFNRDGDSPADNTVLEFARRRPVPEEEPDATPKGASKKGLEYSLSPASFDMGDESSLHLARNNSLDLKCRVRSTRADYYTIPTLESLDSFLDENSGKCIVDSFTIGRKGYGSIFWPGPLDVSNLNLDEIVHIRRKEVIVYPDDDDKPPQGSGLNRPAQVTLDQVWPIDKTTREIIKDSERLEKMRYAARIEAATARNKATFRDYRPATGSWVFAVKHFSKYGLLDDDEDEEMEMEPPVQQAASAPKQFDPSVLKAAFEKSSRAKASGQPLHQEDQFVAQSLPHEYGLGGYSLDIKEDLDTIKEEEKENSFSRSFVNYDHYDGMRNALFENEVPDEAVIPIEPSFKKARKLFSVSSASELHFKSDKIPKAVPIAEVPRVVHKKRELKFLTNPFPSKNKVIADISSIKCSPFSRVSFSAGSGQLVMYEGSSVFICSLKTIADVSKEDKRLDAQLQSHSKIYGHPSLQPFCETKQKSNNPFNIASLEKLVVALYGDRTQITSYAREHERLNNVIDWLCESNKSFKVPSGGVARIIYYLATNNQKAAVDEALLQKQPRLALCISTATCNATKEALISQLDSWKRSGADQFIEKDLVRTYLVLSGGIKWRLSTSEELFAMEGLHWKQQLAILLLYSTHTGLGDAVTFLDTNTNDVEYHLLCEHSPWVSLSACSSELEAWFLHESLISYGAINSSPLSDALHGRVVAQLLVQSVKWATFVALHIKDDKLRGYVVQEVLGRDVFSLSSEVIEWLEKNLLVSKKSVDAAKAVEALYGNLPDYKTQRKAYLALDDQELYALYD